MEPSLSLPETRRCVLVLLRQPHRSFRLLRSRHVLLYELTLLSLVPPTHSLAFAFPPLLADALNDGVGSRRDRVEDKTTVVSHDDAEGQRMSA